MNLRLARGRSKAWGDLRGWACACAIVACAALPATVSPQPRTDGSAPASSAPASNAPASSAPARQRSQQPPAKPSSPDQITLNFKEADIDSVVGAFGHLLNRTFLIDPRVRGKVTLETPRPVSRVRAFELLQAALRVQGFAVVDSGSLVRVVPEADAKLQSGTVSIGRTSERGGDQVVTQIFRLNYESATNLIPVLRPLITPNNTITAYPSNNSLVITDYAANLQRLGRIIATLDSPATSEIEVVQVRHAVASDIAVAVARMVDDASRAGQGAQVDPGQRITVLADPRMNSVMVRTSSLAKMNLAKSLIARLDQPNSHPGNIHVVYLRNAEAARLALVLRSVLSGDSGASGAGASAGAQGSAPGSAMQASASGAAGTASGPATTPLANSGSQQGGAATSFSAGGATIAADPSTNSLIITAPEPVYRNLRAVIERLDARRAQVFIESLIVEVTAERAAELGVQWQFLDGIGSNRSRVFGGTNLPPHGSGNILDLVSNPLAAGQGLNLGVIKGTIDVAGQTVFNLGLLARALESKANANILATPNLLTLDNEEARIIIGQNVPFITGQFTATGTGGASVNPFQTIERRDVGTTLRVRPQVSESGTVRLQIFQEVSNVSSQTAQGLITNRRAIESNVLVDDGQIVVLGGLIEERVEGGEQKVPGLGDVPVFGQLFRYDNRKRVKTNLLVFLRPVVVRDANSAHGVTIDRYDYIRQLQGDSRLPPHWILPQFPPSDLAPMPAAPAQESRRERPADGPASLAPDIDRAVRGGAAPASPPERAEPAPISPSEPTTVRSTPGGQSSD
ncbi:MAG: type II secretion system secretin GspD [Burkholderiaceae bacterium]|nr:type II secretion system secretin GspD [Burkholderiaceae bacterium]